MTRTDEVEVKGVHVRPRDVLLKVVSEIPRPTDVVLDDVDYLLGVVRGLKDGRRVEWRVRAVVPAHKEYGAGGGDVDTGIPPAIVARMLARGDIAGPGRLRARAGRAAARRFFAEFSRWGATRRRADARAARRRPADPAPTCAAPPSVLVRSAELEPRLRRLRLHAEQVRHAARVLHAPVLVVVVEEDVHRLRLRGELADARAPTPRARASL